MREQIITFLQSVDRELARHVRENERLDVVLLGRSSLVLRFNFTLTTEDVDFIQMAKGPANPQALEDTAMRLFGKGTPHAQKLGLYLDRVPEGMPPLPSGYRSRCEELVGDWKVIRPLLLDLHDFAATKMKRFSAKDAQDLKSLCDLGLLNPDGLKRSLDLAFCWSGGSEEDPSHKCAYESLDRIVAYLKTGTANF